MADRDRVAIEIDAMLAKAEPLFTTASCIYRVPHEIRHLKEDAYTPEVVSIGPFHHGNTELLRMEGHKQVYCQHFIDRSAASSDTLVSCVRELEPGIRSCYSEKIELGVDELVKVMLVDCGFVIELFLRDYNSEVTRDDSEVTRDDVIFSRPLLGNRIIWDLLLLENQIPFFVFEKLYNLAFRSLLNGGQFPSFLELAYSFHSDFNIRGELPPPAGSGIAHFTDLLRNFYLQPSNRRPSRKQELVTLRYSASELNEAGVKFTVKRSSHSKLELELSGGILKIPQIKLGDSAELLFRNMVALEQCHYPRESYITDYVIFLGQLINTNKDADVLIKEGIINCIGGNNSTVAKLFNDVRKNTRGVNTDANYLQMWNELNAYYEDPWHTKMATLRRDYCNTPWKTAASIAGIALLILTVIQAVCSILQIV